MSYVDLATAALLLMVAGIVLVAWSVRLTAHGQHRAAPLPDDLLAAVYGEQMPSDSGWRYCPEELRQTYHRIDTDGTRTCWTCAAVTEVAE